MKIIEFHMRKNENHEKLIIPRENHENNENLKISLENNENYENLKIQ